jgi:hypothetical protein
VPGFGGGPFGSGAFGEWPWSLFTVIGGIPGVYRDQDQLAGAGTLQALLEGLVPSLDGLRRKIRDYDQLRDPLQAPIDTDFQVPVIVIRTDDQGDGTSIVFLSEGPDGDKFQGVRPGMVLIDLAANRFTIASVHSSALPDDVDDPPIDPATGELTGRHVIVDNIGQSSTELIPFTSSTLVADENPVPVMATGTITAVPFASIIDGQTFTLNDGVHPAVVFEFDTVPDGVVLGNIQVDISGLATAVGVASAMVEAINTAPNLNLTADNGLGTLATVTIQNFGAGTAGNFPTSTWSDTVVDAGFVITQPTGGAAGAFPLDPLGFDDGLSLAPYVFNTNGSYVGGLAIAPNRVTITWTEGGLAKTGFFTAAGLPGGDLADTSTISRSSSGPTLAAGQIIIYNDSGAAIDADSIKVTYTKTPLVQTEDAEIRAQNILAFLSGDYGIKLDRNDPEFLQRSYVNNSFKIWDIKGTELGYDVLGQYAGYFVSARPLYSISASVASSLPPEYVFEFPEGDPAVGSIDAISPGDLIDGETFTLDDGVNPPVTFEFDIPPNGVIGGNVAVDISAATTALDVADAMVAAINGVVGLDLTATNDGGTSTTVTITNAENGEFGNVNTWIDTVADAGFVITQPTGGIDSDLFTTINPGRGLFDEIALDAIPLDTLCSDSAYPQTTQAVNATTVTFLRNEGSNKRARVTVTTAAMYESFNTDGVFTDLNATEFDVLEFTRVNATTYTFETSQFLLPVVGAGTVDWNVFKFEAPNTVTIVGLGTDVVDLGIQYSGYTGRRYRITKTFTDPVVLSGIGNWAFIDSDGVISYIEKFELVSGNIYQFEIVSATVPATGPANIFYFCEIVTSCDFCRASSILIRISPSAILSFPESLEGDALGRLVIRLQQMIPGHVRIAAFVYDPGPAIATWGPIAASSVLLGDGWAEDALYTAIYDEDEFPADEIPVDSAPIIASSEVTITNENVLEEYLVDEDPLIAGTWLATGQWQVSQYRSSTSFRSFNYGDDDVGVFGEMGAVAPNYDNGAISTGTLTSPTVDIPAATTVLLKFRHFGQMRAGGGDDVVTVNVVDESGPSVVQTITKTDLGLFASGTNGGFTSFSVPIGPAVIGNGNFHLEFVFNSVTTTAGQTGEGWYVDDIEIQVIP